MHQIVASPRRPQTLGKIERFWGTLWRECLESAVFLDLAEARQRIGLFIDYYNFQRPHQGIEGLVPADRFFYAAPEVLQTLKQRVAENARELARQGVPKPPFYLTGQVAGQPFSVHQEGDRVVLQRAGQEREEIELVPNAPRAAHAQRATACATASRRVSRRFARDALSAHVHGVGAGHVAARSVLPGERRRVRAAAAGGCRATRGRRGRRGCAGRGRR